MNIFFLHDSPMVSAQAMTNKHVVKMILETAQLLSTAHHVLDSNNKQFLDNLYKPTHRNHPSSIWTRESVENYEWLYEHFLSLCKEYTLRYGKVHATETKLKHLLNQAPKNIPNIKQTPIRIAIANTDYHKKDPVKSYRIYYLNEKIKNDDDFKRYVSFIPQDNTDLSMKTL
jgi:hypothetical protein